MSEGGGGKLGLTNRAPARGARHQHAAVDDKGKTQKERQKSRGVMVVGGGSQKFETVLPTKP